MTLLLLCAVGLLAFANGANDNFKGVATLFGSGLTNYRNALGWATLTTFAGSLVSVFLANQLAVNFSGKGLVPAELVSNIQFALSVAVGAALTIVFFTWRGLPVSTTHAIIGGLLGAGISASGLGGIDASKLGKTFVLPLLLSPLLSMLLSFSLFKIFRLDRRSAVAPAGNRRFSLPDYLHFFSAGVVSFARGLNDTPKLVGIMLIIHTLNAHSAMLLVGFAMAVGGWLGARKVANRMSKEITPFDFAQGFSANAITSFLVTCASLFALPVSTTHVSVGALFGIGAAKKEADIATVRNIVLAWLTTLPFALVLSFFCFKICSPPF